MEPLTHGGGRKRKRAAETTDDGPYPNHVHPSPDACRAVHRALVSLHPEVCEAKRMKREEGPGLQKSGPFFA